MDGITQDPISPLLGIRIEGSLRRRSTREWAVLAVAALDWAPLAVMALSCVAAGVTLLTGLG